MDILKEPLPGCRVIRPPRFEDQRGAFVKTYHNGIFKALGVTMDIHEEFFSISRKDVLRGMHFQLPPHDHDKLVFCTAGAVLDVLLDLRKGEGYGRVASFELSASNAQIAFIPKGVAHGFLALTDDALMLYKTSTVHAPDADGGILWNSFGFDWPIEDPIISARDQQHQLFADFDSPF